MEIKSTYNLRTDFSFRGEKFFNIPLTWRLGVSNIELLKIRVAGWKPKSNRSNQAIFYFDVKTKDDAFQILEKVKDFNFKKIQNYYEKIHIEKWFSGNNIERNTGATQKWLDGVVIPELREKYKSLNNLL